MIPVGLVLLLALTLWIALDFGSPTETDVPSPVPDLELPEQGSAPKGVLARALSEAALQREALSGSTPIVPLFEGYELTGRVKTSSGQAAVHALVWSQVRGPGPVQTYSGAEGRYTLMLPAGEHRIQARAEGTGTSEARARVAADRENVGPTLTLDEGGVIHGRLFFDDGTPAPDLRVRCQSEVGEAVEFFGPGQAHFHFGCDDTLTGSDGRFRLKGLEEDVPHTVFVDLLLRKDIDARPKRLTGVLPGGSSLQFEIRAIRSIEGIVRDAKTGQPIEHFKINGLFHREANGHFEQVVLDDSIPVFEALGYQSQERLDLRMDAGQSRRGLTIDMLVAPDVGEVRLLVTDEAGGQPEKIRLHTRPEGVGGWIRTLEPKDGKFVVAGVEPGPQRWSIDAPGHSRSLIEFDVRAGEQTDVEVALQRGAAVRLKVADSAGSTWSGDIAVVNAEDRGPHFRFEYSQDHGTLFKVTEEEAFAGRSPARIELIEADGKITGLAAGSYSLLVYFTDEPVRIPFQVSPTNEASLFVKP